MKVRPKVMLVDTDEELIAAEKQGLEEMGCEVLVSYSAREAEKQLLEMQPDCAIVNLMLEYADSGFTLAYHIKKKNPATPVIMLTPITNETGIEFNLLKDNEKHWIKAECLLPKPLRFEQLRREVRKLFVS
ncbi:MAG: hypothetical protein A2293_05205 [Elusimicrobia bacterium RIFOXYB2_FULL_49_7]|nr:MAG: hypothetical protein A2293_05205 [Elusimicrobia bacterium RIFOXYB2_FULL_49_7]